MPNKFLDGYVDGWKSLSKDCYSNKKDSLFHFCKLKSKTGKICGLICDIFKYKT
jgi:hypothetical protein